MRQHAANAIDWYINKLNTLHLVPVNLATMLRDISAKQIGGAGFAPRPLTADNFTDSELDAINRLADKAIDGKRVAYKTYYKDLGMHMRIAGKQLARYLSPLNTVRTTLGQFAVVPSDRGQSIKDTYDFNQEQIHRVLDNLDGTFSYRRRDNGKVEKLPKSEIEKLFSRAKDGAYGALRQNAANFGHTDKDPDSEKIKVDIPRSEIDRRLGESKGKHDIFAVPDPKDFTWRSAGAGALTGAPIGASLGMLSGLISLINQKNRKKWLSKIILRTLGGAAIGAALGGAGAGLMANAAVNKFNSNEMNEKDAEQADPNTAKLDERSRKTFKRKMVEALSYAIPVAALAGFGIYGASRLNGLRNRLLDTKQDIYSMRDSLIEWVKDRSEL